jgi:2-C-methyl-D-erythritol 2,4-cyclodiphosphate synthase
LSCGLGCADTNQGVFYGGNKTPVKEIPELPDAISDVVSTEFPAYDPRRFPKGLRIPMNDFPYRVGLGHDTHRLAPDRALILGGVRIEYDRGLLGHSDADILLHAVADALLGAAGLGDIGDAFPDTDPAYAGIDSAVLLTRALERMRAAGWKLVNLDCTIFAQRPKLAPHKRAIRERLSELLSLPVESVNVKAKTGELVGPIGREEAMSADAVVLLCKAVG